MVTKLFVSVQSTSCLMPEMSAICMYVKIRRHQHTRVHAHNAITDSDDHEYALPLLPVPVCSVRSSSRCSGGSSFFFFRNIIIKIQNSAVIGPSISLIYIYIPHSTTHCTLLHTDEQRTCKTHKNSSSIPIALDVI